MIETAESVITVFLSIPLGDNFLFNVVLVMVLILLIALMAIMVMQHIDSSRDLNDVLRKIAKMEKMLVEIAGKRDQEENFTLSYNQEDDIPPFSNVDSQEAADNTVQNSDRQITMEIQSASNEQVINNLSDGFEGCGLNVNSSISYNHEGPVKFDVKERKEAAFVLQSDMKVLPAEKSFGGYNNAQYYRGREFLFVYDFQDKSGRDVVLQESVKLLQVQKPAVAVKMKSGYQLLEKGVLIVEKK